MKYILKRIFTIFVGGFIFFAFFSCVSTTKESPAVTEQTIVKGETSKKAQEIQSENEAQESNLRETQNEIPSENEEVKEENAPAPTEQESESEPIAEEPILDAQNPFVEPDLLEVAQEIAGFEIILPEEITNFSRDTIEAIEDSLIQVFYKNLLDSSDELLLRKALGNLDITGDYNKYSYNKNLNDEGTNVLLRGKSAKRINAVSWTEGDFSYAIVSKNGISQEFALNLVHEIF